MRLPFRYRDDGDPVGALGVPRAVHEAEHAPRVGQPEPHVPLFDGKHAAKMR